MIRYIASAALATRSRTAVLLAGVIAVVSAAALLGGVAATSQARIHGTLAGAFRPAYDILVRPQRDVTPFERRNHLVRDNFLSNEFGGISRAQLAAVRAVPGVEAAPIENVGYVLASRTVDIPFRLPRSGPGHQLFRVGASFLLPGATEAWGSAYVYVARSDRFTNRGPGTVLEELPGRAEPLEVCGNQSQPATTTASRGSPFTAGHLDGYISCYSEATPASGSFPTGSVVVPVTFDFPLLLAAVDPRIEAAWFGVSRAMTRGRYLSEGMRARRITGTNLGTVESIPVIASSRSYLDERLLLSTALVSASNGAALPLALSSPSATRFAAGLPGRDRTVVVEHAQALYGSLVAAARASGASSGYLPVPQYWVSGQPGYRAVGHDSVVVSTVRNPISTWRAPPGWGGAQSFASGAEVQYVDAPPGNAGVGYERLSVNDLHPGTTQAGTAGGPPVATLDVIGEFDPLRLPGYSAASRVPLETFRPPVALAAGARAAAMIGGRQLGPTTNLAGYVAQPPSLLTTLAAASALYGPSRYLGSDSAKPISAILVRLTGALGTGTSGRARLEAAATAIRAATGLTVDITAGSSPTPVHVALGGDGTKGQALDLVEGWTRKGVTYDIVGALDAKTVGLAGISALVGLLFVASSAAASVRSRRKELAVLLALGWRRADLFRALLGEVLLISTAAAATGALLAVGAARGFRMHLGAALLLGVAAATPLAAGLAACVPIWLGTRYEVLTAMSQASRRGGMRASRVGLAIASARAAPGRALVASGSLAIAIAAFSSVLTLQRSFSAHLVATKTVLGSMLDLHVRGLDVAASATVLVLGAVAVVNTTLAAGDERLREHAILAAAGWRSRDLLALVATEAGVIAGAGVAAGLATAIAACASLGTAPLATLAPSLAAGAASLAVVLLAVAIPTRFRLRANVALLLGGP